ncbi:MAG: branched-chain amino acid ABC transporter permease [Actinomycetia bacterium]|nr:branched-chain amino acid ABC transporter permease [Actinomycetes bacterium]MCP4084545.1 branched-chain amino acid ABC transporter permease [Actinomycetes bacterium]
MSDWSSGREEDVDFRRIQRTRGDEIFEPGLDVEPPDTREFRPPIRLAGWALVALCAVLTPSVFGPLGLSAATRTLALATALLGLQVLLGHAGLLSLGHGALIGIGAWLTGVVVTEMGVAVELAIPLAALVGAGVGVLIGLPALRVQGIGLALLTLALAVSFPVLHRKFVGPLGKVYDKLVPPVWTGLQPGDDELWSYVLAVIATTVVYLALRELLGGRFGRSLRAVRDDPVAAAAFGVPVARIQLGAFALSSAAAGVAGAILVARTPFVSGADYPFQFSIQLFAVALLVGADRLLGALGGAIVMTQLPRALSGLGWVGLEDLIYAVVLLVIIRGFRGRGVGPWLRDQLVTTRLGQPRKRPT